MFLRSFSGANDVIRTQDTLDHAAGRHGDEGRDRRDARPVDACQAQFWGDSVNGLATAGGDRMSRKWLFLLLSSSLALLWFENAPAEPKYEQVNSIDLVGGHIPDDAWIETTGRVWATPHGVYFGLAMPSAMAPLSLDVSGIASQQVDLVASKCKAQSDFEEGCQATIHGKTGRIDGRRGVFVTNVAIQ